MILDATQDLCAIGIGQIENNYPQSVAAPAAQGTREKVRPITEAPRHLPDVRARAGGNAIRRGSIVQHHGHGSHRKATLSGNVADGHHRSLVFDRVSRYSPKSIVDNPSRRIYIFDRSVSFHLRDRLEHTGKQIRVRRILRSHRGSLVVAFDHPMFVGPIPGTGFPARQIARFVEGGADALLLNLGMMRHVAAAASRENLPGIIARLDWTTALGTASLSSASAFRSCLVAHPEDAMRAGADAVITFLVIGSEIQRTARVSRECERLGMPLIVESVTRGPNVENPRDPEWLMLHTRIAAELGADLIKTEYSGDPKSMRTVVDACPIPILVLGGSRSGSDQDVLKVVRGVVQSGAAGVFFGRNVFQAKNIPGLLQRIHAELSRPGRKV